MARQQAAGETPCVVLSTASPYKFPCDVLGALEMCIRDRRRTAYGVGIERVFPVNSPFVEKVEVVRKGRVRRAKLFYLRERTGKAAKVKEQLR